MWANKPSPAARHPRILRQAGVAAIEFALLAGIFFTFVFGIIEVARLMFVFGTLQEVTRRAAAAAANVYPSETTAIKQLKQNAIFRSGPGQLVLAAPVSDANVSIEYLALVRDPASNELSLANIGTGDLPSSPAQNRQVCMRNPNAANCIRFVQVSICVSGSAGNCMPVTSTSLLPLAHLAVPLHKATTIVPVESFGYTPGMAPTP